MADIFFGKFSELVSSKDEKPVVEVKESSQTVIPREKKSHKKLFIYLSITIIIITGIYLISWIALK